MATNPVNRPPPSMTQLTSYYKVFNFQGMNFLFSVVIRLIILYSNRAK